MEKNLANSNAVARQLEQMQLDPRHHRGRDGMALFNAHGNRPHSRHGSDQAVDVQGAGDCPRRLHIGFTACHALEAAHSQYCRWLVVMKRGTPRSRRTPRSHRLFRLGKLLTHAQSQEKSSPQKLPLCAAETTRQRISSPKAFHTPMLSRPLSGGAKAKVNPRRSPQLRFKSRLLKGPGRPFSTNKPAPFVAAILQWTTS